MSNIIYFLKCEMTLFKNLVPVILCCIIPLIGVSLSILLFLEPNSLPITCILLNASYSDYYVSGEYNAGLEGLTNKCGPTLNYQLHYEIILPDNSTTNICGLKTTYVNCCGKTCITLENNFYDNCPPLLVPDLLSYSNASTSFNCWLNNGVVTLTKRQSPYGFTWGFFIACSLWLLCLIFMFLNLIYRSMRHKIYSKRYVEVAEITEIA